MRERRKGGKKERRKVKTSIKLATRQSWVDVLRGENPSPDSSRCRETAMCFARERAFFLQRSCARHNTCPIVALFILERGRRGVEAHYLWPRLG